MGWNTKDIVDEMANLLGDTGSSFKAKTLGYVNDIQVDICSKLNWPFLRKKGQKTLSATEEQDIDFAQPIAPTVALAAGGSLTENSTYSFLVTFYASVEDVESRAGLHSTTLTATAVNKTVNLTAIPVSDDPLVTSRYVYMRTDSGNWYFHTEIEDNTTTTLSISTATDTVIEAPEYLDGYSYINELDGSPYITSSRQLSYLPNDQLRLLFNSTFGSGDPTYYFPMSSKRLLMYPTPTADLVLNYYYFKTPNRLYYLSTSIPTIPPKLKLALKYGIEWLGYDYRDRDGKMNMFQLYENELRTVFSRMSKTSKVSTRVRDTQGSSGGFVL